jgi:hypothetical protein
MIVTRRFADEKTIAFRDQPTAVGHRPSTELRRQAMPTNFGVRVFYVPPSEPHREETTVPSKWRQQQQQQRQQQQEQQQQPEQEQQRQRMSAPTVPLSRRSSPRRFVALVLVCLVAMIFGMGLGFMVRESQARAAMAPSSQATTTSRARSREDFSAHARTFISLSAEKKEAPTLRRPPPGGLRIVKPASSTSSGGSSDDFEPSFRVSP